MARWRIGATGLDRKIARAIAHRATPALKLPSRILTRCADEHLVLPVAAGIWFLSRAGSAGQRREADHLITSIAVAAVLPHLMKHLIAQERPDRLEIMVEGMAQASVTALSTRETQPQASIGSSRG